MSFLQSGTGSSYNPSPQPRPEQLITIHACADRTIHTRTRKSDGEASEAAFLARACALGFSVATPWGDSNRYDLLVQYENVQNEHADAGHGFWRVQVKSSQRNDNGRYSMKNGGNRDIPYTPKEIDFIAAHIVPLDLWYIVPIQAAGSRISLRFYPNRTSRGPSKGQLEKYREAWCLLACNPKARGWNTREGWASEGKARGWDEIPSICRYPEINGHCEICPLMK